MPNEQNPFEIDFDSYIHQSDSTIEEAQQLIDSYETRQGRTEDEDDSEEADKVSVRIREILAEKTFSLHLICYFQYISVCSLVFCIK